MSVEIISEERYKMLKFAFEKGANLAPIDFADIGNYETSHNVVEKLIISSQKSLEDIVEVKLKTLVGDLKASEHGMAINSLTHLLSVLRRNQ